MALQDDIAAARDTVIYRQKRLATDRREARMYDNDMLEYPAALVLSIDENEKALKKSERALIKLTGSKAGVGAKTIGSRDELLKEIGHTQARVKELETEIAKNDRYQRTGDEHLIRRQIGYLDFHEPKLKKLERALREFDKRKSNPMAKKKTKRKATPAQLRALKKAHAALRKKRALKKKAPKRTRRNPAYGNYQKARSIARGSRAVNPVRKLQADYGIQVGSRWFDGSQFSAKKQNAARWHNLTTCKRVAQKLADATGKNCRIVDMHK